MRFFGGASVTWTELDTPFAAEPRSLWTDDTSVVATFDDGTIAKYDGTSATPIARPAGASGALAPLVALVTGRSKDSTQAIAPAQPARYVLWFVVASYAVWMVMFSIYRYAVTLEMLARAMQRVVDLHVRGKLVG